MTRRQYIYESPQPGRKDRSVLEYAGGLDGSIPGSAILALPGDTPGEVTADILAAIRKAYDAAIRDRSAELIPEAGWPGDPLRHLVHAEALDAIAQWATGYTTPTDDTGQHYIALEDEDAASDVLTLTVSSERHGDVLRRFRVRVLVEEVADDPR